MLASLSKYSLITGFLFLSTLSAAQTSGDRKTIRQLKEDIAYLASDELEGRRTGSEGERKAGDYIINIYTKEGIQPYKNSYRYPFNFPAGKEVANTTFVKIGNDNLHIGKDAFPLPYSDNKRAIGEVLPDVMEQGNVWLLPVYQSEEEANDPHFEWEKYTYEKCREAVSQGATGIIFYDGYGSKYPPKFDHRSEYEKLNVPVALILHDPYESYIHNYQGSIPVEMSISLKKTERTGNNIAAYVDNGAPLTVVLGAHYDHLGLGEDGNSLYAGKEPQIHNGADDNASGTAALLQLAKWVKKGKLKKYNYLFINFSGEELGLLGSKAFVKDMALDSTKIAYMINMDMVGRLNDSTHGLTVGGIGTSPAWPGLTKSLNKNFKLNYDSSGVGPSDHSSFYLVNVPVLFFFTGTHTDYHKPSDDAGKINYPGEALVMNYVYDIVKTMDKAPRPAFTTTKQSSVGKVRFKVTLGIIPDYSFQEGGVRADGISEGKPAWVAGMKAGDIIIQLGATQVNGMQSYMEALGKFKAGDKTTVIIMRGKDKIELPIIFQ